MQITVQEIEQLKRELEVMKSRAISETQGQDGNQRVRNLGGSCIKEGDSKSTELDQIVQNRRDLLETGVYSETDQLIVELDERIRQLKIKK